MSEENKRKLNEQLIRCVLDDKLSNDKKLRKMDYIIKMGADVNVRHEFGYSALGLAKAMKNEEIISFWEGKGAEDMCVDKSLYRAEIPCIPRVRRKGLFHKKQKRFGFSV